MDSVGRIIDKLTDWLNGWKLKDNDDAPCCLCCGQCLPGRSVASSLYSSFSFYFPFFSDASFVLAVFVFAVLLLPLWRVGTFSPFFVAALPLAESGMPRWISNNCRQWLRRQINTLKKGKKQSNVAVLLCRVHRPVCSRWNEVTSNVPTLSLLFVSLCFVIQSLASSMFQCGVPCWQCCHGTQTHTSFTQISISLSHLSQLLPSNSSLICLLHYAPAFFVSFIFVGSLKCHLMFSLLL